MSTIVRSIENKAEKNIRKWQQSEKAKERLARPDAQKHIGPYLAISRETGACGSELARLVADRLHWDVLDQEIVDYMEANYGTPRCLLQRVDEKHENWLSSIITSRIGGLGFSEQTYSHRVAILLAMAASHGNVVIVGRGARYLLPRDQGLSVRVVAPMDFRLKQIMDAEKLNAKDARRFIVETDHDRNAYIKDHFGKNANDPHLYDLVVNTGDVSLDDAADTIIASLSHRMKEAA